MQLLVKGNATVTEWLRSPIVYFGDESFRDGMLRLAASLYDPVRAGRHYLHVGLQQREGPLERLTLKRLFSALRPAVTLLWLRTNPGEGAVPAVVTAFIARELSLARDLYENADPAVHPDAIALAEEWFRGVVEG